MGMYAERVVPWMVHQSMSYPALEGYRQRVVGKARGRVLEIGIGSGLNLPFYGTGVEEVVGVDPSARLLDRAREMASHVASPVELIQGRAEGLPFDAASFDTAVVTWSLCSVSHPEAALAEVGRVLRSGGQLVFVEHGRSPESPVARWQDRLTPLWSRVSGGCHLNRDPEQLLARADFRVDEVTTGYLKRPKIMTWMVEGSAHRR